MKTLPLYNYKALNGIQNQNKSNMSFESLKIAPEIAETHKQELERWWFAPVDEIIYKGKKIISSCYPYHYSMYIPVEKFKILQSYRGQNRFFWGYEVRKAVDEHNPFQVFKDALDNVDTVIENEAQYQEKIVKRCE